MRRLPLRFSVPALGAFAAVGLVAALVTGLAPAAHTKSAAVKAAKTTVITVTAGKPSELAFKLSKTSMVAAGTITFNVTNMGVAFHNFRVCTKPVASADAATNACSGKTTKILKHGDKTTLTVTISKSGKYEFLCTVSGHAQAGMKGLIGIGVAVAASEQKTAATAGAPSASNGGSSSGGGTTTPATTTKSSSGGTSGIDPSGCPPGVTIKSSGAADADGDELGTEPDDNDGCV